MSLGAAGHCLGFISILGGCDEPCPGVVKLPVQRTFWSLEFMNFSRIGSFFKKPFEELWDYGTLVTDLNLL